MREESSATRGNDVVVNATVGSDEWDRYVAGHPEATPDHQWIWRDVFSTVFGQQSIYLAARRAGEMAGVLPLVLFRSGLFGRSVVSVPFLNYGGVLADDETVTQALIAEARIVGQTFGASHVELRHAGRRAPALPFRQHKIGLVRALPATVDALWADTDRKVRNQVRKAQKEELAAACGGAELVDGFYRVFSENMRDLGTPVYSRRLFEKVMTAFGDRARVFLVRRGDRPIAGAVAIRFRDTVIVPWASALRAFRSLCPNMLLYWSMLEHAVEHGAATFDFGRSSPGGGTHQFKLQWGAREFPLFWEYVLLRRASVPDHGPTNPKLHTAVSVWKHCPLWLANAVGPSIVRNIP